VHINHSLWLYGDSAFNYSPYSKYFRAASLARKPSYADRLTVTVHLIISLKCKEYEAAHLARKPETVYFLLRKKMKQSPDCSHRPHPSLRANLSRIWEKENTHLEFEMSALFPLALGRGWPAQQVG
jgi:hypothetical protein